MNNASSFSERMRADARRTWDPILGHRFFREVATDAVDDRVFARYLRMEYGFVDTAAVALGHAVAKAPSFQERQRLGLGLHGLVTDQEKFFIDAFERMGARGNEPTGLPPQGLALPLHALFLNVAEAVRRIVQRQVIPVACKMLKIAEPLRHAVSYIRAWKGHACSRPS